MTDTPASGLDMAEDNIDLSSLDDEELTAQMHDDLYDGLEDEIAEGTNILLGCGWSANKVLNNALVEGMCIVGIDIHNGILFMQEVLLAANAMKAGMAMPIGSVIGVTSTSKHCS